MTGTEASIIASVLGVGLGLAILIMRTTARLDRRIDQVHNEAGADRRAADARAEADRHSFQQSMDAFRAEMQRLAERQAHVEGTRSASD